MADTREFPTVDAAAAPGEFTAFNYADFPAVDAAAAVVAMNAVSLGASSAGFATHARAAQPGRFRSVEG